MKTWRTNAPNVRFSADHVCLRWAADIGAGSSALLVLADTVDKVSSSRFSAILIRELSRHGNNVSPKPPIRFHCYRRAVPDRLYRQHRPEAALPSPIATAPGGRRTRGSVRLPTGDITLGDTLRPPRRRSNCPAVTGPPLTRGSVPIIWTGPVLPPIGELATPKG